MEPNPTPQPRADQEPLSAKRSKRAKLVDLGKQRLRRRVNEVPEAAPAPPRALRPGTVLGYFVEHFKQSMAFQVQYGAEQNLWVTAAVLTETDTVPTSWREFAHLQRYRRFKQFALISWRNGMTTFAYNGDQMEPSGLALHSPAEALIEYRSFILYWHFVKGHPIRPTSGIWANDDPEYLDPTNPAGSGTDPVRG